jgi:hypothetical protein
MESVSNTKLFLRAMGAAVAVGTLGFVCGYFGPLYLLPDPGVGPLTALFAAPIGACIGLTTSVYATVSGLSGRRYSYRLLAVALLFAAGVITLVIAQ